MLGANDRIRLGFIGCGMQFQDLLRRGFLPRRERQGDIEFVEVCDVWQPRVDNAKAKTGAERGGRDYRALLARADIDGVVIVVPDHLHYPIARAALLAGKDVYLEKPMTYTIDEAAKLHDVVQQTGRMLQVGGSGLNSPLHQKLHEYVQAGKMGKVVWGFISYNRNTDRGHVGLPDPRHRQRGLARRGGHAGEPRLASLARRRAEAALQQGALLPVAQVLGLLGRQCHRPAVPPPRRPQRHRRLRFPDARRRRRRHLRPEEPPGARHLHDHRGVPEGVLLQHGVVHGQRDSAPITVYGNWAHAAGAAGGAAAGAAGGPRAAAAA